MHIQVYYHTSGNPTEPDTDPEWNRQESHTQELWERINTGIPPNIPTLLINLFAGLIGALERFLLMCVEERVGRERGAGLSK